MIRKSTISLLLSAFGLILTTAAFAAKLDVGSKAPALKVAKWVKGSPVMKFEKGKVYVVEFWATWCTTCKVSIPHLSDLQKKYKGKATFIGVSVTEGDEPGAKLATYLPNVVRFVKNQGAKMSYNVAVDRPDAFMATHWIDASEFPGLPAAFVVNQQGKVAWIGHPMDNLDETVGKVIAGKYDLKAIKAESDKAATQQAQAAAKEKKIGEAYDRIGKLAKDGKNYEALDQLDTIMAKYPELSADPQTLIYRCGLLIKTDEPTGYAYAKELSEKEPCSKLPKALSMLAWMIVDDKAALNAPDYQVAADIAEKAVTLSKSEDAMILDTLAYALFKKGDTEKAIETEEKAMKILEGKTEYPKEVIQEITDRYEMMKKKRG